MVDLNNYVCSLPFTNMELHDKDNFMCCPSWLLKKLPNKVPISELWNSQQSIDIRKSVMDGSYKYCDKTQCPYLSQLIKFDGTGFIGPVFVKNELPNYITNNYDIETGIMNKGPKIIQMSFDRTCNYKCPSCRLDLYVADSNKIKKVQLTIDEIETEFGGYVTDLYITGSGDPFVSVGFRTFLRNFNPSKFPMLKRIHLHTNASMWTKEMWNSMKKIHKYVKTCEISIDAATKETYETQTRLGGNWDVLINNLKFISTIETIRYVKPSFVVQDCNYKEMKPFLDLMKSIFGKKAHVFFGKINNWGTFSAGVFNMKKVWDSSHPEFNTFVDEFNKVCIDSQVFHNMQEFVEIKKDLI